MGQRFLQFLDFSNSLSGGVYACDELVHRVENLCSTSVSLLTAFILVHFPGHHAQTHHDSGSPVSSFASLIEDDSHLVIRILDRIVVEIFKLLILVDCLPKIYHLIYIGLLLFPFMAG